MIKVLQFAPGFRNGGIESRMLDWYRNIDRTKIQFVLVKLNNDTDTPNLNEFSDLGGKYYNLPPFDIRHCLGFGKSIRNIIKKEKIDIVHVHDINTGLFVLREAKKLGIRCRILHSRTTSYLPNEKNKFIKELLKSNSYRYANHYFACSYEAGVWGIGEKLKDQIVVIKNGIQTDRFIYNVDVRTKIRDELRINDKIVIGSIGRLSPQKNIEFLIDIIAKLDEKYVLLLVGGGDFNIVTSHEKYDMVKDRVILVGNKKNVWDYYMAIDIFCGASHYEGFGTTAIESQCTGLPTILSVGFPSVVQITNFCHRINTNDEKEWIKTIESYTYARYPEEGMNSVLQSGYNATDVAKWLQFFYEDNV